MPKDLQELHDALLVANAPKGDMKEIFSLNLGVKEAPTKPSFYNYSDDTVGMKYDTLSTGELVKRYENYLPGSDNNERLAQNQSTGEKWANGLLKFGAKTLSSVVGGTAGVVNGVGAALNDGKFSSVYDNDFSNWLADLDTKMNYQLPNYYTKQEQEKGFLGQMGTANFWADKFLGGLSFTAGAIVSEGIWAWATGGASLASTGARLGTKLARAGRWSTEALGEAGVISGMSKFGNLLKKAPGTLYNVENTAVKAGIIGGKAGELANLARFTATSAGYESSVEALQYKREATENFYNNFERLNGRAPQSEDIAKFEKDVESSANAVFGVNMAIVGSSNLVTMGNIFNLKSPIKTGITDFIEKKAFGRGLTEVVDDVGKVTYKAIERTGRQKASGFIYNYLAKPMVTEGLFEEGGQGITTKVANKWIEHTYDPKKSSESLDMAGLVYDSMAEQYGTKEGWVENGLGMLIGIVGGSVNAVKGEKQKTEELEFKASVANTFDSNFLQSTLIANKIKAFNQIKGFNEDAKIEAKKGNIVKSQLSQNDAVLAFINAKNGLGNSTSDIVEEAKQAMDTVTPEQWKEAGITDVETHKEETLGELERIAKSYDKNKTYWKYMIGNKLVGETTLDTGALDEVAGENLSSNNLIIESLTWAAVRGENAGKYMNDIQGILSEQVGPEHARTLEVLTDLNKQDKKAQRTSRSLSKQHSTLIEKRDALVKKIERLNAAPREIETNKGVKNRELANTNQALLATNEKITNVESQLNQIAESINATKAAENNLGSLDFSQDTSGNTISGQDLISLEENVKKFQNSLDFVKQANQQRGQYIEELLDEHQQASDIFMLHQATMKMASTAKLENINTWVGTKLKSKKEMDADTREWLSTVATEYKNRKLNTLAEQGELINDNTQTSQEEKEVESITKEDTKGVITPKSNQEKIDELEKERQDKLEQVDKELIDLKEQLLNTSILNKEYTNLAQKVKDLEEQLANTPKTIEVETEVTATEQTIEENKADIERRKGFNGVEEIIFSNPNFRLEGFEIDGNYWNVVTSTDRAKVLVNINGVIVPFYLTTGQAGKGLVPGWYPFFGIGKDGWLNKTDKADMETYYERYWGKESADIVKSISEELNNFYGTESSNFKNDGDPNATSRPLSTLADKVEDYINSKLNYTPAINNADARKTLRSNVEQLGKEINAKYDAELSTLNTTSNQVLETIPNPKYVKLEQEIKLLRNKLETNNNNNNNLVNTNAKTIKLSEKGRAYTATFENGVLSIVDKEGKTPSDATLRKIQKKYAQQLNYTQGQLASDRPDYAGNENNWANETLDKSNNAWEIASTALLVEGIDPTTLTVEEKRDLKEVELADRIGKITLETFKEHSDISNLTPQILKTYISADGEAAYSITSELNNVEDNSLEFTEQDVVDFIIKYPEGKKQFYQSFKDENKDALTNKTNLILELKNKFTKLTGLPATKMFLSIAQETGNRQMDSDSILDKMSDEELTKLYNEQEQSFYEQTTNQAAERDYEGKNIAIENDAQAKRDKINEEYNVKVAELQIQDKKNKIEVYKQRIKDLLKEDYHNIDYLGEDIDELLKSRPSKADIDRYRELKKQGSQTNEMKVLQRKLKNWKLLDAAIGEDYTSIADLIDLINQHEEAVEVPEVKTEITTEDIESVLDAKSEINDESLLQNFSGSVTAKAMQNGNISFSHLKLGTIADRLGGQITILGKPATKEDLNALQTFDKDIPVTINGIDFTLKASGKIEMDMKLFSSMQNALNMYMFNPNSTSWTYKSISEFTGEDVRKIKSDFDDSIRNEDIYNLNKDEEVDFVLDESDSFNQELLDKFLVGTIDRETLTRQVKIAAVKNGRKISVVKSQRDSTASEAFAALRLKAAENLINNLGADLGVSTKVTAVYLGTPESQINQNGKITQIEISKEAAKDVVQATGFIQDENITASREFPNGDINTSYIGKLSRKNPGQKIPFVVVTKGVYNIAYPVSLVKTADSRLQEFKDLLSSQRTVQEKAIEVNNLIKKYNLDPSLLVVVEDLQNQSTLNKLAEAFDKKENFISVDEFASDKYNKENVADDVTIDIDLDNLDRAISDPKVRVSFEKGDVIFRDDFKEMGVLPGDDQIVVNQNDARNGQINSIKDCI